ncbi:metallophosphoesterase family protein [Promicromonospora iranensis]|uniref:metallophosphoesterase family protein n=1 Tax=Promicromonospora iranensis TaxID=1105144 RepID=UPI0023A9BA44|nr:metallophosphoesterase family protein [Promicromonospora iranensis]
MTRIAVLSDVRGNTPALAAVLAAIGAEKVGLVLNLGDIVSGAVDPRGTPVRQPPFQHPRARRVARQHNASKFYPLETRVSPRARV